MRHGKKFNHLGRKKAHREAMLSNMACSLIEHKRITTTVAKAKALRVYVEPLITKSKTDSTHSRRTVFSYLKDKYAVSELFREVAPKIASRPGGYTRIIKTGFRQGDAAEMCLIELVDFNEIYGSSAGTGAKKKRSRRGGAKKKAGVAGAIATAAEGAKEAAADAAGSLADAAEGAVEKAKDVAENVSDKVGDAAEAAKEVVEKVVDKAGDAVEAVKEKAADVAEAAKEKASDAVEAVKDAIDGDADDETAEEKSDDKEEESSDEA